MSFVTGGCLCGQIVVIVKNEALDATDRAYLCRCKNCRQTGGCLGAIAIIVPESDFTITGEPKVYVDKNTDSGTAIQRAFCGTCGSPIYTSSPIMPGVKILKLSLFDEIPKPSMELYCRDRPSWDRPIEGTIQFHTMPPPPPPSSSSS